MKPKGVREPCCAQIYVSRGNWGEWRPCPSAWKVKREGKRYCGTHDPEAIEARKAARGPTKFQRELAAIDERNARELASRDLERRVGLLLELLDQGLPWAAAAGAVRKALDKVKKDREE